MEPYQQLEEAWSRFNDLDPAGMVACSSGTAALHLALEALQLPQGAEILTPDFTMIACPRAVTLAGLTPVFVDCDERLLMDPALVERALLGRGAGAIMAVHVYGRRCDMVRLQHLAGTYGIPMIEDLAEAHGVRPNGNTDAAAWSFYVNKIVSGAEGGAVWFRNREHARLARSLRSLGFTDAHDFTHRPRGHNYRMSNVHAELILDSLLGDGCMVGPGRWNAAERIERRREIESWYDVACPAEWRMPPRDAVWVYDLRVKGVTVEQQDGVVKELNGTGIAARHGFKPCSSQEEYERHRAVWAVSREGGTQAERASREVVYLPVQPGVTTEKDVRLAFEVLKTAL